MKDFFRRCLKCRNEKPLNEFYRDPKSRSGFYHRCKPCTDFYYKKCSKCKEIKSKDRFYKNKNTKDKLESCCRSCKGKEKETFDTYFARHKKEIIKAHNDRERKRKKEDPIFKIKQNLKTRLATAIKRSRWNKTAKFNEYIGCSLEELKKHIEKQWEIGMNWSNYGRYKNCWSIGYIYPLSLCKDVETAIKACHYSNLRPMWHQDNMKKSNKTNL